jgi:uncharacterized phage protein (TIGR02220 family)
LRARNIKPGFFKNEDLAECDPLARILFTGLWCMADREGRMENRPKRIKAEVLPYDNCNIEKLLKQLSDKKFILIYSINNENYIEILNFRKHQNCHIKEAESTIPAPDKHHTSTVQEQDEHGSRPSESLLLNPESLLLNPESLLLNADNAAKPQIPYKEIIEYLNLKTGKNFDHQSKETRAKIRARWGINGKQRTIEDFKRVIDNKCASWGSDPKMVDYLRPDTLFGTKFEGYLNEQPHRLKGIVSDKTVKTAEMLDKWEPPNERQN